MNHAIVRRPSNNFASGLTTADLGLPDLDLAHQQHRDYCAALVECGLNLTTLEADDRFPDSTFVEDTAILSSNGAIITRPGADSRAGEIDEMSLVLSQFFATVHQIEYPGTVDGGDVCEANGHFFIGLSERTNRAGAEQLEEIFNRLGYTSSLIDLSGVSNILHLKSGLSYLNLRSGLSYLSSNSLVVIKQLESRSEFAGYERIVAPDAAEYAANCVEINGTVLVASGFPSFENELRSRGYRTRVLDMSEFQKMDGGLSCLSLRF